MTPESVIAGVISAVGAVGGLEAIKYLLNRKSMQRKTEAEAEKAENEAAIMELGELKELIKFLETQLREKEERFVEQTTRLRKTQDELLQTEKAKGKLEAEINLYKCIKRGCTERQPPNGY